MPHTFQEIQHTGLLITRKCEVTSDKFRFIRYYWGDLMKEYEMVGHVARKGELRNAYSTLIGEPEGKRPL